MSNTIIGQMVEIKETIYNNLEMEECYMLFSYDSFNSCGNEKIEISNDKYYNVFCMTLLDDKRMNVKLYKDNKLVFEFNTSEFHIVNDYKRLNKLGSLEQDNGGSGW